MTDPILCRRLPVSAVVPCFAAHERRWPVRARRRGAHLEIMERVRRMADGFRP